MFCNKCGSPVREGNSFCSNCGNPVSVASAPIPTYVPPAVPTEVPAHDRPPVSSYSKTYNYENDSSETFLFAAPDLDMATPAPKKSSEPVYIPPLDPVEEPVVVPAPAAPAPVAPAPVAEETFVVPPLDPVVAPVAEPVVEQPVVEQPVVAPVAEPVYEQPVVAPVAEPVYEQPVVAPVAEPVVEQPVVAPVAEPVVEQPVVAPVAEPVYEQPVVAPVAESVYEQPVAEPVYEQPVYEQPAYEQPVYADTIYNEPPVSYDLPNNKPVKTSVAIKIISAVLCLFMFVTVIGSVSALTIRSFVSAESMIDIAETLDMEALAEAGIEIDLFERLDSEELQKIYDDDKAELKPFIEEILVNYGKYLTGDAELKEITAEDYNKMIEDSSDVINKVTGEENDYTISKNNFEFDNLKKSDLKTVKLMISWVAIITMLALSVIFAFLLFMLRKFKSTALLWNGITIFVAGLCYTVLSFVLPMFMDNGIVKIMYEDYIQSKVLIGGIIVMAVGLLFVIGYVVTKIIMGKKNK